MTVNIHIFCIDLKTVYDLYTYFIISIKCMNQVFRLATNVFVFLFNINPEVNKISRENFETSTMGVVQDEDLQEEFDVFGINLNEQLIDKCE